MYGVIRLSKLRRSSYNVISYVVRQRREPAVAVLVPRVGFCMLCCILVYNSMLSYVMLVYTKL